MIQTAEKTYKVCCFKHDGHLHRVWQKSYLVTKNDEYLALANDSTLIQESDGRVWQSRDPAVTFFFTKEWFNVICMFRPNGIHYYCNIASPYIEKDNTIFYIDYDLDLSLAPNNTLKILDEIEYYQHAYDMKYPTRIEIIAKSTLSRLRSMVVNREFPFDDQKVLECYKLYKEY